MNKSRREEERKAEEGRMVANLIVHRLNIKQGGRRKERILIMLQSRWERISQWSQHRWAVLLKWLNY